MDQILNKVGSYWIGQKANKELNSVGDDINVNLLFFYPLRFCEAILRCYGKEGRKIGDSLCIGSMKFCRLSVCLKFHWRVSCRNFCSLSQIMSFSTSVTETLESEPPELIYSELQHKMQGYAASGCIKKAVEVLYEMGCVSGKPTVHDYNSLLYSHMKSKVVMIDELGGIYLGMKRFGPPPNAITFNTLLNGMVSLGRLRDGILIAKEMWESGFSPSFSALSKLLKKSFILGSLGDTLSLFVFMLRLGYVPTEPSMRKLILALCEVGRVPEAYQVLSVLISKGCFQGVKCFNPLLWALCKSNHCYNALAFLCFLKKKGFECDVSSYTALVYGFGRKRAWNEVFHILDEMEANGCAPNVITYTIVIKFLSDDGKIDESLDLLKKMENEGCSPDLVTYNVILRALSRQGRLIELRELVQVIDQKGLTPDEHTHAALAGGLLKGGKASVAERLIHQIISSCCFVDVVIYNIYFNILCNGNKTKEALSTLNSMMEIGFEPTTVSYNTILKGICKEKSVYEAVKFFNQIIWPRNKPDMVSFNTLLCAACKQGDSPIIERILYRMEYEGFALDIVSSTCLILYFCMVQKTAACLKLLDYIIANCSQFNIVVLNSLISSLCKNRLVGKAYTLYRYSRSSGISPDATTYNILICASIKECNYSLVDQLLGDMYKQRLGPDIFTCGLIYRFCKEGKLTSDILLKYHMLENGINQNGYINGSKLEATLGI